MHVPRSIYVSAASRRRRRLPLATALIAVAALAALATLGLRLI